MRTKIFILVALVLVSFKYTESLKPNHAQVEKVNGLYVFVKCEPLSKFEKLGSVKSAAIINSYKADYLLEHMTDRVKKQHPTANAVIFTDKNLVECDAVKISE